MTFWNRFILIIIVAVTSFMTAMAQTHDPRYTTNETFLFEKHIPITGDGTLECVRHAVRTFPLAAPYYSYFNNKDIKIVPDIDPDQNIGVIFISPRMTDEAFFLPSGGRTSPILILQSLLRKMCPRVRFESDHVIRRNQYISKRIRQQKAQMNDFYKNNNKDYAHYMLFQTFEISEDIESD
ncbi:MAG: hypothetical protein AAF621_08580 [Pseudomonadota bacterium]